MPKRTFWMVTGVAVGAGSSLWAERRVRRAVEQAAARLQPDALAAEVGRSARSAALGATDRFRGAIQSAKEESVRREEEIWNELATRGVGAAAEQVPAEVEARWNGVVAPPVVVEPLTEGRTGRRSGRRRGRRSTVASEVSR